MLDNYTVKLDDFMHCRASYIYTNYIARFVLHTVKLKNHHHQKQEPQQINQRKRHHGLTIILPLIIKTTVVIKELQNRNEINELELKPNKKKNPKY